MGLFLCIRHLPAGSWPILSLLTTLTNDKPYQGRRNRIENTWETTKE
jgi:hypothetical protein